MIKALLMLQKPSLIRKKIDKFYGRGLKRNKLMLNPGLFNIIYCLFFSGDGKEFNLYLANLLLIQN